MAKVKLRAASNFRDIMPKLVEYSNFDVYLDSMLY